MKKLLTYVFAIIAFVACSESDVDNVSKISLSDTSIRFEGIGGSHMITFSSSTNWSIEVDESARSWCSLDNSSGSAGNRIVFVTVSPNLELDQKERETSLIITTDYTVERVKIVQEYDHEVVLDIERKSLMALYDTFKDDLSLENWGSKESLDKWFGIHTNDQGRVTEIRLSNYNLDLIGHIPSNICNLLALEVLHLNDNTLMGELPMEIGNLTNLRELWLHGNSFSGTIPESLINLTKINDLRLYDNRFSGTISESFYNWDFWQSWWGFNVIYNSYKFDNLRLPGPKATVKCFDGSSIDLSKEYANNKYTILFQWGNDFNTEMVLPQLKDIYDSYSKNEISIIGWTTSHSLTKDEAIAYARNNGMSWDNFYYSTGNIIGTPYGYPTDNETSITVVDSTGKIVFSDLFDSDVYLYDGHFIRLMDNDFKKIDSKKYESTDFSKDGEVKQLQKATKGNGIDIVLMGDAYSDRMISLYDRTMKTAMEKFFDVEPYKSFRDYFNVYSVTAISKNEVYTSKSSTAFSCYFGSGTYVGGNDSKVFSYGRKAISEDRMDEALFVIVLNDYTSLRGTCYMYSPSSNSNWGNGTAVAYFTIGWYDENFEQVLHHEAGGHGFAKLADEYDNKSGEIPENEIKSRQSKEKYGWYRNADFTSDPDEVKWSHFLKDSRYKYDGLGVFEGAFTYAKGAYRPTENSIMNENTGGFNAPSREAIYYRIHKLAYGADWEYDYEEFVRYDAKNRKKEESRGVPYRLDNPENFQPTHPPVVINKSWRDAK